MPRHRHLIRRPVSPDTAHRKKATPFSESGCPKAIPEWSSALEADRSGAFIAPSAPKVQPEAAGSKSAPYRGRRCGCHSVAYGAIKAPLLYVNSARKPYRSSGRVKERRASRRRHSSPRSAHLASWPAGRFALRVLWSAARGAPLLYVNSARNPHRSSGGVKERRASRRRPLHAQRKLLRHSKAKGFPRHVLQDGRGTQPLQYTVSIWRRSVWQSL
jgi:hypothetical protein